MWCLEASANLIVDNLQKSQQSVPLIVSYPSTSLSSASSSSNSLSSTSSTLSFTLSSASYLRLLLPLVRHLMIHIVHLLLAQHHQTVPLLEALPYFLPRIMNFTLKTSESRSIAIPGGFLKVLFVWVAKPV